MPRLFTAIEIPEAIRMHLSLVRAPLGRAKWIEPENMHITLRFAGDIDGRTADEFVELPRRRPRQAIPGDDRRGWRLRRPRPARALGWRGGGRAARRAPPRQRPRRPRSPAWSPKDAPSNRT